ncbi:MAG: hypothetical protein ACOX0U_04575 [Oscillospiraceae bacterium]
MKLKRTDQTALPVPSECANSSELAVHPEQVAHVRKTLSNDAFLYDLAELVKFRRSGKVIYYSLDDDHVSSIIAKGAEHVKERD